MRQMIILPLLGMQKLQTEAWWAKIQKLQNESSCMGAKMEQFLPLVEMQKLQTEYWWAKIQKLQNESSKYKAHGVIKKPKIEEVNLDQILPKEGYLYW